MKLQAASRRCIDVAMRRRMRSPGTARILDSSQGTTKKVFVKRASQYLKGLKGPDCCCLPRDAFNPTKGRVRSMVGVVRRQTRRRRACAYIVLLGSMGVNGGRHRRTRARGLEVNHEQAGKQQDLKRRASEWQRSTSSRRERRSEPLAVAVQ